MMRRRQRQQRPAQVVADAAAAQQRLARNRVRLDTAEVVEWLQARIPRPGGFVVMGGGPLAHAAIGAGPHVGPDRNQAVDTGLDRSCGRAVIATEHRELRAAQRQQRLHPAGVAHRFLDADDIGMAGQFGHGLRLHVATGAAGHVVQHDRQPALVGNRAVVRDQAGRGRYRP
ncbi:hypothetical protein G6F50_015855 [Rhizopus delemar]|uniref:Uncharacterized protein n=1 Tax=Rhizopus delemar TaxID=936053 RepID=A0A9P6XVL6_9FUNG|nr:hypothetical protein G6F50_015855 [Rhizopus delemar]